MKNAGANEVVIMRVVAADKRGAHKLIPGAAGNSSDIPGTGTPPTGIAEMQQLDALVSVETLVYSLDRSEPLWSGTSRTANPQDMVQLVNEVANAATKEMVKQRLLARQQKRSPPEGEEASRVCTGA